MSSTLSSGMCSRTCSAAWTRSSVITTRWTSAWSSTSRPSEASRTRATRSSTASGEGEKPLVLTPDRDTMSARCAAVEANAYRVVLRAAHRGAGTQAELDPAGRERIECERLAGHDCGVPEIVVQDERSDAQRGGGFGCDSQSRERRDAPVDEVVGDRQDRVPELFGLSGRAHPLITPGWREHMHPEPKAVHLSVETRYCHGTITAGSANSIPVNTLKNVLGAPTDLEEST